MTMKMNETKTKLRTRMLQIENPSWGSKSLMVYRLCAIGQGWLFNGFLWSQLPSSPLPSSPSLADFIMIPLPGVNFRHNKIFHMAFYLLEWCVCSWFMPVKKEDTDGFGCGGVWTLEIYANLISPENWIQSQAGIESDSVSVFIRVY